MKTYRLISFLFASLIFLGLQAKTPVAYDMETAREICDELPLEAVEGIWIYPEDNVTVLILGQENHSSSMTEYSIRVVETTDARIRPGEEIGKLYATAKDNVYKIELKTESKNELLLKPKSVLANLSKEGDTFLIQRDKPLFKGRISFNFNRLLPGFWKIVSTGISSTGGGVETPVGMVKVYPSYDGNGSSRRKVRYL